MKVSVTWKLIDDGCLELWDFTRCLYCYASVSDEILYIGKVGTVGSSVRKRWIRSAKRGFWDFIESEHNVFEHSVAVGLIELPIGNRLTSQLLSDVESLLIHQVKPPGNVSCINNRTFRPGISVVCKGDWFHSRQSFLDS